MDKKYLRAHFTLNPPATPDQVALVQAGVGWLFPKTYVDFLLCCNGLHSPGCLVLHAVDIMAARNAEYEVQKYLPGYFMIGDDSGGQAILMNEGGEIFEVGMGVMRADYLAQAAQSIEDLLVNYKGLTLGER